MSIQHFIPTLWSETLYSELEKDYVGVRLCNREFEGEIRGEGDRVKICGIDNVSVFNYHRDEDMPSAEVLSAKERTLIIDQAKGFNFCLDSVDAAQAKKGVMQQAMKQASNALADVADRFVYSLYDSSVATVEYENVSSATILPVIAEARKILMQNNVPSSAKLSLEVSPAIEEKLLLANVLRATDNTAALGNGYLGSVMGFDIYVSNNLHYDVENDMYRCVARTGRAIAFAEQLSEVKAYEPELRHGDAVKGLHLYGAKIIYPKEMVYLNLSPALQETL